MSFRLGLLAAAMTAAASAFAGECTYPFAWYKNNPVDDFPVPVTLEEGAGGFSYTGFADAAGGTDLRVFDTDGTTPLAYEIENWNPSGKSVVWVKVPYFSKDTTLTLKWGEDATDAAAADAAGLWSGAVGVYHFAGQELKNAVNGDAMSLVGSPVGHETGPLGNAARFDRTGNYSSTKLSDAHYGVVSNQFTISFWISTDNLKSGDQTYLFYYGKNSEQFALLLNWYAAGCFAFYTPSPVLVGGASTGIDTGAMALPDGGWHHVAMTYDGATFTYYVDGFVKYSKATVFSLVTHVDDESGYYLSIGAEKVGVANAYKGLLDEFRFENVCRGADRVRADCETQAKALSVGELELSLSDYRGAAVSDFPAYFNVNPASGFEPKAVYDAIVGNTATVTDRRTGELLPLEFEYALFNDFDNSFGFWTKLPRYSSEDGVKISIGGEFACYCPGESEQSAAAQENVFDSSQIWNPDEFLVVYHMNPTGYLHDVVHGLDLKPGKGNSSTMAHYPLAVDGPTGPMLAYHSSTCSVQRLESGQFTIDHALTNVYTVSWWMKEDADEVANPKRETYLNAVFGLSFLKGAGYKSNGCDAHKLVLYGVSSAAMDIPTDGGWHQYVVTCDGSKTRLYCDGALQVTANAVKNIGFEQKISSTYISLASSSNAAKDACRGSVDEFRFEAVCRDADWIAATYHNQKAWQDDAPYQLEPAFAKALEAEVGEDSVTVSSFFSCRQDAKVTLYWGERDGERNPVDWRHASTLGVKSNGRVSATVELPADGDKFYFRFCAQNAAGAAWSEALCLQGDDLRLNKSIPITVNYAGAETLRDFPVCVTIPAANRLPADRSLVRFFDADGRALAWEAERWDPSGESRVWVTLPELPAGGATVTAKFGARATKAAAWPAGSVWNREDYVGVYHFENETLPRDSSASMNHIVQNTLKGVVSNGVSGTGFYFAGEASGSTKTADGGRQLYDFRKGFTMSLWAKASDASTASEQVLVKLELRNQGDIASGYYHQIWFSYDPAKGFRLQPYIQNNRLFPAGTSFSSSGLTGSSDTTGGLAVKELTTMPRPDEDWHHYTVTQDGMFLSAYRDGELVRRTPWPFILNNAVNDHKYIELAFGNNVSNYSRYNGFIDECRLERVGRGADWVKATYDNLKSGSTFVTVGPTEQPGLILFVR